MKLILILRIAIAWLAVVSLLFQPAFGWSEAGHRIIASIAFRQLDENQQKRFAELIATHPRFTDDFDLPLRKLKDVPNENGRREWLVQQASIWPDIARGYRGDLKATYHHGPWHYINLPIFLFDADEAKFAGKLRQNLGRIPPESLEPDMNIIQVIRKSKQMISDKNTSPVDRAIMLTWLCHTIGDIHQPLHSCALFSGEALSEGDKGGNAIKTKQRGNLHALWDQFPGGNISWETARNRALTLMSDTDSKKLQLAVSLNEEEWLKESYDIAAASVYSEELRPQLAQLKDKPEPIVLSEAYLKAGGEISKQRMVLAGIRLGKTLQGVMGE